MFPLYLSTAYFFINLNTAKNLLCAQRKIDRFDNDAESNNMDLFTVGKVDSDCYARLNIK